MRRTKLFIHLKSSLWFVPVLCVLAGAALSFATIAIDRYFDYEALPHSFVGGPDAAAYILSTVAASMVGLAALVLTITMVVVQLAMGQFSPRIVQRILRDKHGRHLDGTGQVRLIVRTMSWEAYVHLAFDEIRLAGGGSPQVTRRLKAALTDLRSVAPPERVGIIDLQLDLLSTTTEASLSDERDVELALHEDREGIGAAATSIDGTALFVPCSERSSPR